MSSDLFSNKKGVISDSLTILVFSALMAFALVIIFITVSLINDGLQASDVQQVGKDHFSDFKDKFIPIFDVGFFVLLLGLIIAGVIGLFIIDSHPVLMIASWIGLGILLFVAAALSNSFSEFANSSGVSTYADQFTFIPLVMNNFVGFLVLVGGIFAVALYAKLRG